MSDAHLPTDSEGEVETALLDAELFIKYRAPERAIKRLHEALERRPRSLQLRERLREIAAAHKHTDEAARQCLALASLYIEREDLEAAHDRLLEAKQLDPRISITTGLEAIRRARRPDFSQTAASAAAVAPPNAVRLSATLSGDLSAISIFDAVQVLENARLTGTLSITNEAAQGRVFFNEGRIVGAEIAESIGEEAFRKLVEVTSGAFDFERHAELFPVTINAASNTNLLLDSLRQLDEENM